MTPTPTLEQTWNRYTSSWKAVSAADKRARFDGALSPECVYTDPLTIARGWEELIAYMTEFHRQVPGGHFVTTRFIAHHDRSIACWSMVSGDGTVLDDGISYGEYDVAGRLVAMTGFFDPPKP